MELQNDMIYVLNYADGEPYESYRKTNTKTAYRYGKADKVIEFTSKDIPQSYKEEHKDIFAYKRGAGLWLWKPYIIYKALTNINDGEWLFYSDAGVTFINDINHLVRCATVHSLDIFTFEQPLLCRQFTKKECYIEMGLEDHGENQALGLLLLRKSDKSIKFVKEWLHLCETEKMLSPNHFNKEIEEWPDYYAHREDQSLLSLLRDKWGLPAFRDCSDYGEMPFMYSGTGKWTYNPKEYPNSTYPTIILCNRKVSPWKYWLIYKIKHILNKMGIIYTEKNVLRKRGIKKHTY